jgi:uncharacterized membrane protein
MTRDAFLAKLRQGLAGLPQPAIDDIVADYEAHFAEGLAAGRSEAEVGAALGDPSRLARELRAEASLKQWESRKDPSAAVGAIFAVLGLSALDILVLLPILISVASVIFGLFIAAIAIIFAGGVVFAVGVFGGAGWMDASPAAAGLAGVGLMAGGLSAGAVLTLITTALVNFLVWFGRLHYRLLKPAIES